MPTVHGHVVRVNEYIIKIYHDTDTQKIRKYIVYELLEAAETFVRPDNIMNYSNNL